MKRKLLSILLTFTIILSMFVALPVNVYAATEYTSGDYTYTVTDNRATIVDVATTISGNVTIPSTLDGYTVVAIGPSAFKNCSNIKYLTISDNIISIGNYAFEGCNGIYTVDIGSGIKEISSYCFNSCTALEQVTLGKNVEYIGSDSFSKCTALTTINWNTKIKEIRGSAFAGCKSFTNLTIPDSVVTIGDYAFSDCSSIVTLDLRNGVQSLGRGAFIRGTGLRNVTIPDSVTKVGEYAFEYCERLTTLDIGDGLQAIPSSAFSECIRLKTVTLGENLTNIDYGVFLGCTALTTINWNNKIEKLGKLSFQGCTALTDVSIPDSVTTIGESAFNSCSGIKNLTIGNGVIGIEDYAFYRCTSLTTVVLPDSVNTLGEYAFKSNTALESVVIGEGLVDIPGYVFQDCTGLTKVVMGENTVTIGTSAFENCSLLNDITFSENLRTVGPWSFKNCTALNSITLPSAVTAIGRNAFEGCTKLSVFNMGNKVTKIGESAFQNCVALASITITNSVTLIEGYAFYGCTAIKNVYLPISLQTIGSYAFKNCNVISDVYYAGDSVDWSYVTIETGNTALTNATIHYNYMASDNIKPTGSISGVTNNVATNQTVTLNFFDNVGVAGYYWGTSSTYSDNAYTSTSSSSVKKTITAPGTYYLFVKDTSGNLSSAYSINFYKITLNANGGSVSPSFVIAKLGNTVTLPTPTNGDSSFIGWGTSATATSGVETIIATSNTTLYALWKIVEPSDGKLCVSSTTITPGETFTVNVSIKDNPGIWVWSARVYFPEYFTVKSVNEVTTDPKISITAGIFNDEGYVKILWDVPSLKSDYTDDGVIAQICFQASSDIPDGQYELTPKYDDGTRMNLDKVYLSDVHGTVTVESKTLSSISIKTAPSKTTYYIGDSFNSSGLTLTATYSDGSTKTISNGFSVSGFSSTTAGTKTVTVSYEGVSTTFNVTVKKPTITLSSSSKSMSVGDTSTITATTTPSGQAVTWTSSNSSVATVSNGTITAKGEGTATITAKFTYNGTVYSATCSVAVTEPFIEGGTISLDSKTAGKGTTFKVDLKVSDNPGFSALNVYFDYDKTALTLVKEENKIEGFSFTSGSTLLWDSVYDYTEDGVIATLTFKVNESATKGDYTVKPIFISSSNSEFNKIKFYCKESKITVVDTIYGDASGDGIIDTIDLAMMRIYLANYNPATGESSVKAEPGIDANGDGTVDTVDLAMLRRYLAFYNPSTGESDVVLGPQ